MNYTEAIEYIHNTPKFARVLGNDMLRKLLDKLGNPQRELKIIHIAGTNGKGSAAIMLSEILIRIGYRTGLFTSPYIERFNERIKVDGVQISDEELAKHTTFVRDVIEEFDTPVSEFALDTAIAFDYFRKRDCDIVILEVGLGGRLDATNVIDKSLLSVIMSIGMDHMQYLGGTIAEIAAEKCGIIKQGGRVVVYPVQEAETLREIERACAEMRADLVIANTPELLGGKELEYDGEKYELCMGGDFQKYNAATVICAVSELRKLGILISNDALRDGLKAALNPARLEEMPCGLLIDGAHNLPAVRALCAALRSMDKPITLCIAMMEDKDISGCIAELAKLSPTVIATRINMPRCAEPKRICNEFLKHGIGCEIEENPIEAARQALKAAGEDGAACVCGSLYLAGEVRPRFCGQQYYVYMLRCSDNSLYTGITTDVKRRFEEHSMKKASGARYTHSHTAVSVEAVWEVFGRSEASKLESRIKKLPKAKKEELVKEYKSEHSPNQ